MRYFDWNIVIGNYFFNYEKGGKDVHLFISPLEIGEIGINQLGFTSKEEAIADYYLALSNGYAGFTRSRSIIKRVEILFTLWNDRKTGIFKWNKIDLQIEGTYITDQATQITYPFYLAMLTAFIIPLTGNNEDYRANAYYPRLNNFLKENGLNNGHIGAADFGIIDKLWDDLSEWSTSTYKTDIGIFNVGHFGNRNWIHVGKVFAQCILTPSDIKNLPKLFSLAGFMPNTHIPVGSIKNALLKNGTDIGLSRNALKILKEGDSDLQNVIINIVKEEHYKWKGNIEQKQGEKLEEKENIHIIDLGGCIKASEYFAKQDDPKIKKIKEKVIKNPNTTYVQYNFGSDWQPQIGNQCLWFLTTDYSDNQIYTPLNSWQGVYRLIDDKKGQYFQRYSAPSDTDIAAQVTLVNMEKKLSWE